MSAAIESFECHWQASPRLLWLYALVLLAALLALACSPLPLWLQVMGVCSLIGHAFWVVPRRLSLSHASAFSGLRHDRQGWQLFSRRQGWQAVQLCPQSVVLPWLVLLQVRVPGRLGYRHVLIADDSLERQQHRRLRVRLRFSRNRFRAAG